MGYDSTYALDGRRKTMIFDTHTHYNDKKYDSDREEQLSSLKEAGVDRIVNISASWQDLQDTLVLVEKYPFIYGAVGLHPDHVGEMTEDRFEQLRAYCQRPGIVAVGEIGLDYHWDVEPRDYQKEMFKRQLRLAVEEDMPVVIHSRDAARDTFDIMKKEHAGTTGGIIHCYSGSVEMAREYVKLGYYLGIGGVVTFKNSRVLKAVTEEIPLSHLVLETDCPYLAPTPYRGKRNSSVYLHLVAEAIASLKGISVKEVEEVTYANAMEVYRIKD